MWSYYMGISLVINYFYRNYIIIHDLYFYLVMTICFDLGTSSVDSGLFITRSVGDIHIRDCTLRASTSHARDL